MNYNSDKPIENSNQDLLGRAFFSEQLGRAIYEYNLKEGLVIGLFGKWGTGKTSVINMAISQVESLSEADNEKPIIMKFAPWNYSDKDNLISLFFHCLKSKIQKIDNEDVKRKVGSALNEYAGAFDAFSLVPVVGVGIAALLKSVAKAQGQKLAQGANLDETKKRLEDALLETHQRIIVVIDDIDRLTNAQIRDIFQLVKQVGDFPNVVYLLSMDRDVVTRALEEVHDCDGYEYLEKIIQVTFEIPELRKSKLHNVFFSKLDSCINYISQDIKWNDNYWGEVFRNCINPYLNTLRDVNRVINTFQFRYNLLYQETAFEDMVAVTTLEVLEPKLYRWVSCNKDALCGGYLHSLNCIGNKKINYKEIYEKEFERLGIEVEKAIQCLSALFPVFAKDVNENKWSYQSTANTRSQMRVAETSRFDIYFLSDLEDVRVSRSIINACVYELDKDEIKAVIEEVNNQNNTLYFIEELRSLVGSIPYDRLSVIAEALICGETGYKGEQQKAIFIVSAVDFVEFTVKDILERIRTSEERFEVLKEALLSVKKYGLNTIGRIINSIELAYGRLAGKEEKKSEQIIGLNQLTELEELYVKRVRELSEDGLLLEINGFGIVLYLWECFDPKTAKEYMIDILKDDFIKLKFICSLAGKWSGTGGCGWSFNQENYKKYVSDEEIYKLISGLNKQEIGKFSEEEQIKLASFFLNYNKDEEFHVTEEKAREWLNN
ncbi:KAP family P-loop domain-containing protein [Lachnospiraceae bacterium XPB1003]|nr:KAP family P-loop domain-containing protein [Lachnospiraceae bacterium XPB1003]